MSKRAKRIGILLVVSSLGIAGGVLTFLESPAFQHWALNRIEKLARDAGYQLTVKRLNLNIWRLQASIEGVTLDDGKTTRVRADRFFVQVPWSALRTDSIRITALEAEGVSIDIHSTAPPSPPSQKPFELPRIAIDRLLVRNGSLTYSDGGTSVRIPSFNVDVQGGRGALHLPTPINISPNLQMALFELPLQLSDHSIEFGPTNWTVEHPEITVTGSSRGHLQWSPSLAFDFDYSTNAFSYRNWHDLQSSGAVTYENDVLKVTGFRFQPGSGMAEGNAEIRGQTTSINVTWSDVNLAPAGFPASAKGDLQLQWKSVDFSDLSGKGSVQITSRRYGRAETDVTIRNARASLGIRAKGFDTAVRADVTTGFDQTLAGRFQATNTRYGNVWLEGTLRGSFKDPQVFGKLAADNVTYSGVGPLHGSANVSLRSRTVSIDDIQIELKNSKLPRGSLRADLQTQHISGAMPGLEVQLGDFAPNVAGTVVLSAVIDGTIQKPMASFTGSSSGLDIAANHIDSVKFNGEANVNEVRVLELTAQQGQATLSAAGSYDVATQAIDGSAGISNFAINQVPDLSATASFTANLSGPINFPSADFSGRIADVTYHERPHGDLEFDGTLQNHLANVRVESRKYAAVATAEVGLSAPYTYAATATADGSRVEYQQYDFTANGKVQASGSLQPFTADQIQFDEFQVAGEGVDLQMTGRLAEGVKLKATADLSKLPINNVQAGGDVRIEAIVDGTLRDPRIAGSLETSNARIQPSGITEPANIQAAVDFTGNQFTIRRLQAAFAGATAEVTGKGTLEGTGHLDFRAEGIRPERILKDRAVTGLAAFEGSVDVASPSLDGITGSLKVTQLETVIAGIAIHQVEPIELGLNNHVLSARKLSLEGLVTRAIVTGNADLRTRAVDVDIEGNTDLKIVEGFLPGSNPSGQIRTSLMVRGTPEQPRLDGFVNLEHMQLQISDPPVSVADTNAEIQLRGDRIQIASASGNLNGGTFTASGGADISSAGLGNTAIQVTLTGAQTEYPDGFQSEISSQLSLSGSGNDFEISGNVDILNGLYRRDIDLTQEVLSRITANVAQQTLYKRPEPNAMDQIRLNITVETPGSVNVANNLANFDMEGSFRVTGTIGNPVLTGRARVAEGGELYFGPQVGTVSATEKERRDRYVISEGSIEFDNPIRTEPSFDFVATRELQTKDEKYVITLRASGTADNPKTELTSDPALAEYEIVALLLTGRKYEELQGSELMIAQEQAANYLAGRFGNAFQAAGSAFGLNTVRIDPVLLAGDEDLSARLTIGKDLTRNVNLVYSQNLSGPRAQTWIASYQAIKDLLIRGINRSDENNLTLELRHDVKWGGGPPLPTASKGKDDKILGNITFEGTTVPMKDLLKEVSKPGKPFNAYRINQDVRKLRQFYASRDFLTANIHATRNAGESSVDVHFLVEEGPSITFAFEGAKVPKGVQEEIRQVWIRGFAEALSLRQSQARLLRYFRDEGYLQAAVSSEDQSPDIKNRRFVFSISAGQKFRKPAWVFRGIPPIELNVTTGMVLEDPRAIQNQIQDGLWQDGYLNASATEPRLSIDGEEARFEISVERGPRYSIGRVTPNDSQVLRVLPAGEGGQKPGEGMFTSAWLDRARQRIIDKHWSDGYANVQVTAETHIPRDETAVDVDFKIDAGERQVVNSIEIDGNHTTSTDYIRRQFTFMEGDPLDYRRLNATRKKLYDTRLFKRVDLNVIKADNGYTAKATLNEKPPWSFRYGFAVTDQLQTSDRQFGANVDLSYANLLGHGITTGTSLRYTRDFRDARVFASLPPLFGKNVTTTAAVFRSRDTIIVKSADDASAASTAVTNVWGFAIQQQWQLRKGYVLSYDYSYKRNRTLASDPTVPIARFDGTLSRDTRNDLLNATKGTFISNSFEVAPPGVGSSIDFLRNFTQYFRFQPVRKQLVWASAYRVGLAKPFGNAELLPVEQFKAGGGTTVRAFQQDQLGAPSNALLIVNQELRFPVLWRFSGVGFFDAGNLYPSISDFNPFKLRYSPGAGIRIQTPLVLIRLDLGVNVFPRSGEPRYRFAFGIGQAF